MENSCDNPEDPKEYNWNEDVEHLLFTLESAIAALDALWRLAEPPLARNATRNLTQTARWSYYQVSDALRHSVGWLKRMPRRASDGTAVWDEEPADTNEVLEHGVEEPEAGGELERRSREERRAKHEDDVLERLNGIFCTNGDTIGRQETPEEARRRKAKAEEARLAKLRSRPAPRRKTSKRK